MAELVEIIGTLYEMEVAKWIKLHINCQKNICIDLSLTC